MNHQLELPKTNARMDNRVSQLVAFSSRKARLPIHFAEDEAEDVASGLVNSSISPQDRVEPAMRVLLRDSKTRKYLRAGRRWTNDPAEAQDFRSGWWATDRAFTMNPGRLVIVYEFGDDRYNIRIPVRKYSVPIRQRQPRSRRQLGKRLPRKGMCVAEV